MRWKLLVASLLLGVGCMIAAADQVPGPQTALAIAPAKIRAPYDVQILGEDGGTAPTYAKNNRFYVQGTAGERYVIRVTNPTARRIEAVVSVDGLDVVDGEAGDLKKRGYVVQPYSEVRIEGFRTSQDDVATFRFSSVNESYAGKKGKARNVGVIAVALFEEQAAPEQRQIIVAPYDDDKPALRPPPAPVSSVGAGAAAPARNHRSLEESAADAAPAPVAKRTQHERLGLGTEFGEQRYSAATFTKLVRAPGRPVASAELRYNNAAGLMALGIDVGPMPDEGEIMMRETADPFPGDHRFATRPGFER